MKKLMIIFGVALVFLIGTYLSLLRYLPYIAATKQHTAFNAENDVLEAAINDLMQASPKDINRYCETYRQGHWSNQALCRTSSNYGHQSAGQPGGHAATIERANTLEALLREHGWTNDRLHDPNQTIVATLPVNDMFPYESRSIPMHKNIGNVSCELDIDIGGPTKSPVVNISSFGCSQKITYFFPHISRKEYPLI